jgi:hypothetical protein
MARIDEELVFAKQAKAAIEGKPVTQGQNEGGSIPIPDEKMDDYARDCVVRLANRVDDTKLRERLLQRPANGRRQPWMKHLTLGGGKSPCPVRAGVRLKLD